LIYNFISIIKKGFDVNILFNFGEEVEEYDYRVINEREARASAGIMFLLGIISLFSLFGMRTLFWAELFSITFILEFFIRIVFSPRYAPYMVLGSLFVSRQQPEWVEAKPKHFAWILGAILGAIMTYFIVADIVSPIRMLICVLCLVLLFTESAFGICLGCSIYKKFNISLEGNCPGGACEVNKPVSSRSKVANLAVIVGFVALTISTYILLKQYKYESHTKSQAIINTKLNSLATPKTPQHTAPTVEHTQKSNTDCIVPQWAIDMGHREMWMDHNCK